MIPPDPPPAIPPSGAAPARPPRVHAPRLPGTYAASYERDMDWHRAVSVLWVLTGLAALCEVVNAAFALLQGYVNYPPPMDAIRLIVEAALFLALWLGWGWLRWLLAANNFFYGAWQVVWLIASHAPNPEAPPGTPPPSWGLGIIPAVGTAIVYIVFGIYLAFSADVLDFLRYRRREGRRWVIIPLVVLISSYLFALFNARWFYQRWIEMEKASATRFALQSVKTIAAEHWTASEYEQRADPEYLKTWYEGDRKSVFAALARLGTFKSAGDTKTIVGSSTDPAGGGFVVRGQVELGDVRFEHGHTVFTIDVTRSLFGPWQMQAFDAGNPGFDAGAAAPR